MKIIMPEQVIECIDSIGNRTKRASAYKIFAALTICSRKKNHKTGYFPVPSAYLQKVNCRYKSILAEFEKKNIIEVYSRVDYDPNDLFGYLRKPYYNTDKHICKRYRFNLDIKVGRIVDIDFKNPRNSRWFNLLADSLKQLGITGKISRDSFGRRVHHPLIPIYKKTLVDKGYVMIDAKASQPKILNGILKSRNIFDYNFERAFQYGFYEYIEDKLNLEEGEAKKLIMFWLNSSGFVPNYGIVKLFPKASEFLKDLKRKNYKDAASLLQREESRIWIDDLYQNLPVNFAIPVHDCIIIKAVDLEEVLAYCKERHPQIDFEHSELSSKN